ncbi:helix-hairpin-helix domain-containing protein [bacterium]|nr:helix-hairpin-helix domain-containing protein [bacterium]MCI0605708.1 helix-hairpin-helix domain-containing protein [bacterium]
MDTFKKVLFTVITSLALVINFAEKVPAQVGAQRGLLDVNVSDEKALLALPHMNPEIVKGLLERRPFPSMKELNAFLSKSLNQKQLTDLYGKVFVHVNLNTALEEEILMIPGVGKKMLHEFLEYRPYKSLAQFRREIGKYVDQKELQRLEQYVFVPIHLNTASDEEILSIPGLGPKMLHEFKEYRPYKNIEQFRREIGKYVNAKEVARIERYVTLN